MKLLKQAIRSLFLIQETPQRTAAAFAVGVFLGFSPFIGLHTVLGIIFAFVLRLNKVAVLIGVFVNNPWVFIPFYAFATWVGVQLMGMPEGLSLPHITLWQLFERQFWTWLLSQWRLLIPAVLGSFLLSIILSLISYFLAYRALKRFATHIENSPPRKQSSARLF